MTATAYPREHAAGQGLGKIIHSSLESALTGAGATVFSVVSLMWLHTIITYQQKYGTKIVPTTISLWREGGIVRFYRGLVPSLAVVPFCRFGDTLFNSLALHSLQGVRLGNAQVQVPVEVSTLIGSLGAGAFRAVILPLDTLKVLMQVEGKAGTLTLKKKITEHGVGALYQGSLAYGAGSVMGHYPWYLTYNLLEEKVPQRSALGARRTRSAGIGFAASVVSAMTSNVFRVLKVHRQSHPEGVTYRQTIEQIKTKDGSLRGVFGRGLWGRVGASALQGMVFSVMWTELSDWLRGKEHPWGR
ncbi:unnamed protein product [Discosporangium mesarthrocarpum]